MEEIMYTKEDVLDFIEEEDVKFIRLAFFDIHGNQKNVSIMSSELPRAFEYGISFDASSISGFETSEKSDLFLHPDPTTVSIIPWRPTTGKVIRMFCNIKHNDGTPYSKDCRTILKNAVEYAKKECNVTFMVGPEVEFYLFKLDENGEATNEPFDKGGYMDIAPLDKGENIRRDICFTLEQMGIQPEASHHEEGPGQNEIDFRYSDALTAADNTQTFKWIVRTKAQSNGLYADFNPKPLKGQPGSGMHINLSSKTYDGRDEDYTNYIMAGITSHIKELTYFLNPTYNSYDRLGECKAPKYIACGKENRSAFIRIPASKGLQRIEVRSSDPSCNPYIAFALLIYAACDGIKNKMVPPAIINENLFTAGQEITGKLEMLPDTLESAYAHTVSSDFVTKILGKDFIEAYNRK